MELQIGEKISLSGGKSATVRKRLGQGAQGIVYLVEQSDGKQYALKCYHPDLKDDTSFYDNLEDEVIPTNPPSKAFLWPRAVATAGGKRCGYVMDLAPSDHHALDCFFIGSGGTAPQIRFANFSARLQAAIHICNAFRNLHSHGFSYMDVNPGGFLIRPTDGDVLICDNDNVCPNNHNVTGIGGFPRYKAPELLDGQWPNIDSDRLSMALVLYRIFMQDHPFEGQRMEAFVLENDYMNRAIYGEGAVFVYDKLDVSNRPWNNRTPNHERYWKTCPAILQQAFQKALSRDAIRNPSARMSDREWKDVLLRVRRELVVYRHYSEAKGQWEDYDYAPTILPAEERSIMQAKLSFSTGDDYAVSRHKLIYLGDDMEAVGQGVVYKNAAGHGELGLENTSSTTWQLITASGQIRSIAPHDRMPLRTGMQINFTPQWRAKVTLL